MQFCEYFSNNNQLKSDNKRVFSLLNLTKALTFYIYQLIKVVIVYKNENLVFTVYQVILPGFKSFNNCQKLNIKSFISNFDKKFFSKKLIFEYHLSKYKNI